MNLCKTQRKRLFMCVFGKTKDSYYWRMGELGKYCFFYFMSYAPVTCCLPLPPHSSAALAPKLWLRVPHASHAFRLWPRFRPLENDSVMWGKYKKSTQKAAVIPACQKMKSLKCNDAHCEMRHESSAQVLHSFMWQPVTAECWCQEHICFSPEKEQN